MSLLYEVILMASDSDSGQQAILDSIKLERERQVFERERLEFTKKGRDTFWRSNFPALMTAAVSITAIAISSFQVTYFSKRDLAIKQDEEYLKRQDQKVQAAKFIIDNRTIILGGSTDEKVLLRGVMERSFTDDVNGPVFEMLTRTATNAATINVFNTKPLEVARVTTAKRKIFLQYNDSKDAIMVDEVGAALSVDSYAVQGKEHVVQPTSGDVRFFYESDRDDAAKIRQIVQDTLHNKGYSQKIALLPLIGKYNNVPPGVFEVWLPALPQH
jgi:hypothetical protein